MAISYTERQMSDAIEPLRSKIYELERSLATSHTEANDLRQERDGLKQTVRGLLK
jgi:prefoldin subunit 5